MAQAIGVVSQAMGTVTAVSSDGQERTLNMGDQIYEGEVISTQGSGSGVNITFNNGCKMALGEGESALIDETVYKLEFFEDADVVVDLESAEGISQEVADAQEEEVDEIYLAEAETTDEDIDLDAIEDTAAGDDTTEVSQVDEADIEERVEIETTDTQQGQGGGGQEYGASIGVPTTPIERGGELLTTDAPTITITIVNLNSEGFVNSTPIISGSAPEGSVVELFDNGSSIGTVTVDSSETFTIEPELEDGDHSLTGQIVTVDGVTGDMSDPILFTLDTVAPELASIESADITNTTAPVISGTSESLSSITVTVAGESYTTVADDHGIWSVALDETAEGTYDVSVVVADQAGNVSQTTTISLTIDTTLPDNPVINYLEATNDTTPTVSGTAEAGTTLTLYQDNTQVGETIVNSDESWSYTLDALDDGSYSITAAVTDAAGNTSGSSTVQTIVVDTSAPAEPMVDQIDMDVSGVVVIGGTAESGSSVTVNIGDKNYTVASEEGNWSLSTDALAEGSYVLEVSATDAAGNSSQTTMVSVTLDTSSVSFDIDYDSSTAGAEHTIEDTTLYGIKTDGDFDPDATTLDLGSAQADFVTSHEKGYGVEGGYKGEGDKKAIGSDEALVMQLDAAVSNIEISIDKLNFFEGGKWIAYDADMEKVGESNFSFFDSLFGRDESYDTSFFGNSGTLTIGSDSVDGAFEYIVLTTDESWQGKITSYFVEDVSYETADAYIYDMNIEHIPMDDAQTSLYIDGLNEDLQLQDSEGNSVGTYEDGSWVLGESEISDLATINGSLNLQIVSDLELEEGSLIPTLTIVETSLDSLETELVDALSPLGEMSQLLDFDSLDDVQRIDLSEDEINMDGLNLQDVMKISNGENRLEIVSGEHDEHVLTLDAGDWAVKTDTSGNEISFESDGNAYMVYTSTDADNEYDLIIDQMVTVVLEN